MAKEFIFMVEVLLLKDAKVEAVEVGLVSGQQA